MKSFQSFSSQNSNLSVSLRAFNVNVQKSETKKTFLNLKPSEK